MSDNDQRHVIPMPDGWRYWRSFALRSAGFPLSDLTVYATTGGEAAPSAPDYLERISRQLIETARHGRFREALAWQNPALLDTVLDPIAAQQPGGWNKQHRRRALAIIAYLQRYAAKNDTIGFFGPIEFGTFREARCGLVLRCTAALASKRATRFDYWAVDALAQRCAENRQLLLDVAPRLLPRYRLEGNTLRRSDGEVMTLPPAAAALLARVDGRRSARGIADALTAAGLAPGPGVVLRMIEELGTRGILDWALRVPVVDEPERALQAMLEAMPPSDGVREALDVLAAWREALAGVADTAGDPERAAGALAACGGLVARSTGADAARYAGETYAGRQPVYQDCRRGDDVAVGRDLLERLHGPLALILASARWYTWRIARDMQALFQARFREAAGEAHARLPLDSFLAELEKHRPAIDAAVDAAAQEHQHRWQQVLGLGSGGPALRLGAAELESAVAQAFDAPAPGWQRARYHSPDIMLAAASPAALSAGEGLCVIGEIHVASNTMFAKSLQSLHDDPAAMALWSEHDLPEPALQIIPSRRARGQRVVFDPPSRRDYHLAVDESVSWREPDHVLPISALSVGIEGGRLRIFTPEGAPDFDMIAAFPNPFRSRVIYAFGLLPPLARLPRITVDEVVIQRATWRFAAADLPFAQAKQMPERIDAARAFRQQHGLPRWVFARSPLEPKPLCVDFDNALLIELLCKWIRALAGQPETGLLALAEMLPGPDEAWLADAAGRRYTSELRIVAVDPRPCQY